MIGKGIKAHQFAALEFGPARALKRPDCSIRSCNERLWNSLATSISRYFGRNNFSKVDIRPGAKRRFITSEMLKVQF
jgi:hypothetical protein